jgi:hypothetical protein
MEVLAPIRRIQARRELAQARRAADEQLLATALPPPRLAWRTNELVDADHRRDLAASLVEVVHGSGTRYLPGASPLNRAAARAETDRLLRLAARLAETERPVRPRGVLLVEQLLVDARSPLYARERARRLRAALDEAFAELEGSP